MGGGRWRGDDRKLGSLKDKGEQQGARGRGLPLEEERPERLMNDTSLGVGLGVMRRGWLCVFELLAIDNAQQLARSAIHGQRFPAYHF